MSGHGHGHGHGHGAAGALRVGGPARAVVVVLVVLAAAAAALGVARWWPDEARVQHLQGSLTSTAAGVRTVRADLVTVRTACSGSGSDATGCGDSVARLTGGAVVEVALTPDVVGTGLRAGDRVLLYELGAGGGYAFDRADRGPALLWLALLFAILVVLVALRRGAMALLSLGFAGAVVIGFLVPALLSGRPAVPVVLAAGTLILIVVLYATHGPSLRTSVALVGALVGTGLTAAGAWLGVVGTRLGGLGDDAAALLVQNAPGVDVQQLVVASVVVAGLGALNDVTITQVSAVWELREAAPGLTRRRLFTSAMRIGRDHVASTVYTLVFAYLGTALVLLVAVQLYRGSALDLVTSEDVAEEIVRALVGGVGLVLAMPLTTGVAVLVAAGAELEADGPRYARRSTAAPHG